MSSPNAARPRLRRPDNDDDMAPPSIPVAGPSQARFSTPSFSRGATPSPYGTLSSSTPIVAASASSLFRKNDYTGSAGGKPAVKMKFMPKMDRANRAPSVKKEPVESNFIDAGKGRGRGRGKSKPEMTASGAFSAGPSAPPPRERASTAKLEADKPTKGTMSARTSPPKSSASKPESITTIAPDVVDLDSEDEQVRDADDQLVKGQTQRVPLPPSGTEPRLRHIDKIHLRRDIYPPLNLPSGIKAKQEDDERYQRKEQDNAAMDIDRTAIDVEMPDRVPTPPPPVPSHEDVLRKEMADYLQRDIEDQELHIFQFPRTFPLFRDPSMDGLQEIDSGLGRDEVKPHVRRLTEGSSATQYLEGGWEGYGKRATRRDRPTMGGNKQLSGRVGSLQILEGGAVRLIFGDAGRPDLVYDVLPAALPTFLQELAVISSKESNLYVPLAKQETSNADIKPGSTAKPSMLIMGQVDRKFIVRPDIEVLLREMQVDEQRQRQVRARQEAEAYAAAQAALKASNDELREYEELASLTQVPGGLRVNVDMF